MDRHKFKAARLAQNMSQGALAKAVRLSPSEISRIECGYRDIRPDEAAALAAVLGLVPASIPAPVAAVAPVAVIPPPVPSVSAPTAPAALPTPIPPVGTNLDDPANFTELPDFDILERGALSPAAHRDRLVAALARTSKILHTSRVRATVWREWRQFERKIQEALRPV
jgi:transcriptional regulator with XRE-family HTH domain